MIFGIMLFALVILSEKNKWYMDGVLTGFSRRPTNNKICKKCLISSKFRVFKVREKTPPAFGATLF